MRTIKFRMWNHVKSDPSKSRMFYDVDEVMACLEQQMKYDEDPSNAFAYDHVGDGNVFMQFTGLLDKNGKEIYEGDVITYTNPFNHNTYTHICLWDDSFACFGLFEHGNKSCKEFDWVKIVDIEIIGNIHNQKPLEDKP